MKNAIQKSDNSFLNHWCPIPAETLSPSIIKLLRNKIISIGLTLGQNKTTSDLIAIYNLIKYEYSSLNDILNEKSNLYNEVKTTYILLGDKILKVL